MPKKSEYEFVINLLDKPEFLETLREISDLEKNTAKERIQDIIMLLKAYSIFEKQNFIPFTYRDLDQLVNGLKLVRGRCNIKKHGYQKLGGRTNKTLIYTREIFELIPFSEKWYQKISDISKNISKRTMYRILMEYLKPNRKENKPIKISTLFL